jgi:predicted permease
MHVLIEAWHRARALFRRRDLEQDLDDELSFHLRMREQELAGGGDPRDVARMVRRRFGNVTLLKEQMREPWIFRGLEEALQDARYAIRTLRKAPGFAMVAIVTLALGVGANTGLFSVANTVLIKPLDVPAPDRLVRSVTSMNGVVQNISSPLTFKIWQDADAIFDDVSAHRLDVVNLLDGSTPQQAAVARVSEAFFRLFGAPLIVARGFTLEEDRPGGPFVAVLSHALWLERFGSDPAVVGRTLVLGAVPHTIVGVIGPDFDSEQFQPRPDVWVPLQADAERVDGASIYQVTARLRPGVTHAAADAHLRVALEERSPRSQAAGRMAWLAQPLQDAMVGSFRFSIYVLFGAVGILLLIACANLAGLLLVRADVRRREMAIRAAIGAGRGRIVRQMVIENLVLSFAGGAVGVVVGPLAVRALLGLYPGVNPFLLGASEHFPRIGDGGAAVTLDWHVLGFALLVSLATGILCACFPAWHVVRTNPISTLQETNAPASGIRWLTGRTVLVIAEMSLAVVLVVAAGLLIRTSLAMRSVEAGFDADDVLTMRMSVTGTRFERRDGISELARQGIEALHAVPGVARASTTCCMPLETVWQLPFVIGSRTGEGLIQSGALSFHGLGGWTFVSPGYFDVFRIPILRGRDFSPQDDARAPGVAIINEALARQYWPHDDPLNDRLIIGRGMRAAYTEDPVRQIIGIVGNVRDTGLTRNARPAVYVPMAQVPDGVTVANVKLLPIVWIARTGTDPYSLSAPAQRALESATGLPVGRVRAMREVMSESTARHRFDTWVMTIFGCCALLLAAVGVYGLIAYSVQQRTREIGIRLALGAAPGQVWRMIVRAAMSLAVAAIAVGVASALYVVRVMTSLLFGVTPWDPLTFALVPMLFVLVALLAVCLPAARATRISPMTALRYE